ncbi:MAG: LapA family protein [Neisseria sp.]|nr:LapA family protein [Neisseria sp.]
MKILSLIIKILVLLLLTVLAFINLQPVQFNYLPDQGVSLRLIEVLFGAFVAGAILGLFALFGRLVALRAENGQLQAELKKLRHQQEEAAAAHEGQE